MREETLINAVNDIDDIRYKLEDIHQNIMEQPDYWEKLKHQYAGMVMQGMLSDREMFNALTEGVWPPNRPAYIAAICDDYATALVNRLKEEEND
jgi:hypothetical protein